MAIFLKSIFLMVLTIYLVGLGFILPEINKTLNTDNQITYTTIDKTLYKQTEDTSNCDCGVLTCVEYSTIYGQLPEGCNNVDMERVTLLSSISDLPLWFNTIFIIIPFIMWLILIVLMFLPV